MHNAQKNSLSHNLSEGSSPPPHIINLFGASGDVVKRKIVSELYHLWRQGKVPANTTIVGAARTHLTSQEFREQLRIGVEQSSFHLGSEAEWADFESGIFYLPGQYYGNEIDRTDYQRLAEFLQQISDARGTQGNVIFYLALPSHLFAQVSDQLNQVGLLQARQQLIAA